MAIQTMNAKEARRRWRDVIDAVQTGQCDDLYRVRVGVWRIVHAIRDWELLVLVIRIAARGEAYPDLE